MAEIKTILIKKNKGNIKRALILAGGGVRLAYQAGVLQALEEKALQFDHIDGTSGGIFNTAMLASGLNPAEMALRWRSLKLRYFMSASPTKEYLKLKTMMGFGYADGIRNHVFPSLGIDLEKIRSNQEITATFNVCNFSTKSIESIPHHEVTKDHLIAGVSLPIFMPAIKIKTDWYSDAVWIKDANLMEAVKRGAEEIWLVWAIGNCKEYLPGSFNQYVHMIEMSANGGLLEEYAQINSLNERIVKGDSPFGQKEPIRLHVIKPEFPLPLDPDLFFNKINTSTLINMGYADTKKYLDHFSKDGTAYNAESTKMKDPGITLSFRQHYSGTLQIAGNKTLVSYSPSFNLRKWGTSFLLELNSSIYIDAFGREISTSENTAALMRIENNQSIIISSIFQEANNTYRINSTITLGSSHDWFLGLEFKRARISINQINTEKEKTILEGYLTQSISTRLKNVFSSGLSNYYGSGWKWKEKLAMVKKLYHYEI